MKPAFRFLSKSTSLILGLFGVLVTQCTSLAHGAPTVEIVMERLQALGIEQVMDLNSGMQMDQARLRSIAEQVLAEATSTQPPLLETTKELIVKCVRNSVLKILHDFVNYFSEIPKTSQAFSTHSLHEMILQIQGILTKLGQLPSDFHLNEEMDVAEFLSTLRSVKLKIEAIEAMPTEEKATHWNETAKKQILNPIGKAVRIFLGTAAEEPMTLNATLSAVLFGKVNSAATDAPHGIRREYVSVVLDFLENEEGTPTLREITKNLLFFVASQDGQFLSLNDYVKGHASVRNLTLISTASGIATEAIAGVLGHLVSTGLFIGGAAGLVAHGLGTYHKWTTLQSLWIFQQLRREFNLKLAMPLGINPARHPEEFERAERILCGAALTNVRAKL